jgi:hypothetical protein
MADLRSFLVFAIPTRATCGSRIRTICGVARAGLQRHVIVRPQALRKTAELHTQVAIRPAERTLPSFRDRDLTRSLAHV